MKTITIKQPWATLVCTPSKEDFTNSIKPIENRTWPCPEKYIGKRILVHSSASWTKENAEICISIPHVKKALESLGKIHKYNNEKIGYKGYSFSGLDFGCIIGSVEIVDYVVNHESVWAEKSDAILDSAKKWIKKPVYNWVLANPILFPEPIPYKGKLSFWDYPNICAEPEEKGGELFCHCQLPVKEENQVMRMHDHFRCRYCGGKWYK